MEPDSVRIIVIAPDTNIAARIKNPHKEAVIIRFLFKSFFNM